MVGYSGEHAGRHLNLIGREAFCFHIMKHNEQIFSENQLLVFSRISTEMFSILLNFTTDSSYVSFEIYYLSLLLNLHKKYIWRVHQRNQLIKDYDH